MPTAPPPKASALLEDAAVVWLTTVDPSGQPQASPVWFVIDEGEFLVYSLEGTPRTRNLIVNPLVSLNLDSNEGGDVVIAEGVARVVDGPPSTRHPAYQDKYLRRIERMGYTAAEFASAYPVPIRIEPVRWRSF
ncbi:MAG TPA: pyridoxamine 5'-phosphate oxidase family protein [Acidimicrobiia bacterium]|nr:pyridoxamine 5'-phosphate oxidase family protein [Acidimicrobiia bacterium]